MNTAISFHRESTISIDVIFEVISSVFTGLLSVINTPVAYLAQYYSHCLERQVSIMQTLCLTLAQLAFVIMVITFSISVIAAALGVAMFASSLFLCKKVL